MFTQIKTNFKFIGAVLFTMFFLIGGLFMGTTKVEASSTVQSFGVYYSLSPIISTTNSDSSVTTKILVGCAPLSGDLYDVNTGLPCTNNTKTVLVGCKAGSGDIFDINTGIRCADYIKPVLVGCGAKSGDLYDINVGKRCTNTSIASNTSITTIAKTNKTNAVTNKAIEISPIASNLKETLPIQDNLNGPSGLSGREKIKDTLTASVAKVGSIFNGPISVWLILLVILIILGGGYGIYSLTMKDETIMQPAMKTDTIKKPEIKSETVKPETIKPEPITKPATPEIKTVNTPINPLNVPQNTNPLGSTIIK
ncbi:MAG: hypothetical protein WCW54_02710 [Candidatus Paceibacterota bacterium]